MRPQILLSLCVVLVAGCRCGPPDLGGVRAGFRVQESELDFGRVLEGERVDRTLELIGTGRGDVTVEIEIEEPFTTVSSVLVPGGDSAFIRITFHAGRTEVVRTLRLIGLEDTVEVTLRGEGVRPTPCVPSGECRFSEFDLATKSCIESLAPDNTACTPASSCLENGLCQGGICLGTPRVCDDSNLCTQDACAEGVGCVNIPRACPSPANPCKRAICDPDVGCGEENADDLLLCGPSDCNNLNWCITGVCTPAPTPEGTICGPPTPCTGPPTCEPVSDGGRECTLPDPTPIAPTVEIPLGHLDEQLAVLRAFRGGQAAIFSSICGDGDAGLSSDAGQCLLGSYTSASSPPLFERFTAPLTQDFRLVAVGDAGALVLGGEQLEVYGAGGVLQWSTSFNDEDAGVASFTRESLAVSHGGEVLACYGRTHEDTLGGTRLVQLSGEAGEPVFEGLVDPVETECRVALDAIGTAYVLDAFGTLSRADVIDGGFELTPFVTSGFTQGLAIASEVAVLDGRMVVPLDGGQLIVLGSREDAGVLQVSDVFPTPVLIRGGQIVRFVSGCQRDAGCDLEGALGMEGFSTEGDGGSLWQVMVLPAEAQPRLIEVGMFQFSAIVTLAEGQVDGGALNVVQFFQNGRELGACELAGHPRLIDAVFEGSRIFAIAARADGGYALQAYDIAPVQVTADGWSSQDSFGGGRREGR